MMKDALIALNMKTYPQVNDGGSLELARMCEKVSKETGVRFVVCPQQVDLALVCREVNVPVFAQHTDSARPGSTTGWTTPEAVKSAGAAGTLLNHSEHRLKIAEISELITRCRELSLETIVCTNDISVSLACAVLGPDYIAVEPPELIGGDISVTTADPEIVRRTVAAIREVAPDVKVLTGAGVKTGKDVGAAIELGTCGVLLASGVVKAKDPLGTLYDLISEL